jgi:hypothetical protein
MSGMSSGGPALVGNTGNIDSTTGAIKTIEYEHNEIHGGSHFYISHPNTLNSAATYSWVITTPNTTKWCHMIFNLTGSAITTGHLYEDTERAGSTAATVFNSNRNSLVSSTTTVHRLSAAGANGLLIWMFSSGAATESSRSPSVSDRGNELILKQNAKYLLKVTSGTASNLTNLQLNWYEHQNR